MATIVTRSGKGSALTIAELDANFNNLNTAKLEETPTRASVRPTLLLDFAKTKTLDPRVSFTRASTATYYDGKTVAKAEENLLVRSQEFDDAAWGKTNVTVTANSTTAPDGTSTADTVTDNSTNAPHQVSQVLTNAPFGTYTNSVYVKAGTASYALVQFRTANGNGRYSVIIDLSNGAVTATNSAGSVGGTNIVTSVGNGWYRVALTGSHYTALILSIWVGVSNSATPTFDADSWVQYEGAGSTIYVWGAQVEQRSSVTAYTPTTTDPITNYVPQLLTAPAGVPRFDHNPVTGESLGLMVEEQRTNLQISSEDISGSVYRLGVSVSANNAIAPNGTLTADLLTSSTNDAGSDIYPTDYGLNPSQIQTFSMYVKQPPAGAATSIVLDLAGAGSRFTFSGGAVVISQYGNATTGASVATPAGNGWWRVSVTTTKGNVYHYWAFKIPVGSLLVWGVQLENGSFPSSYIPTAGSQVTRSADAAGLAGSSFSSIYRDGESTLSVECDIRNAGPIATLIKDDGSNTGFGLSWNSNGRTNYFMRLNGAYNPNLSSVGNTGQAAGLHKMVVAASGGTVIAAADGVLGPEVSSFTPPQIGVTALRIGASEGAPSYMNGAIRKLAYYPKRLTNAELQAITTP